MLHLYDLSALLFYKFHLSTNDFWYRLTLEGTCESGLVHALDSEAAGGPDVWEGCLITQRKDETADH